MLLEILKLWMINLIRQVSYKYNAKFKNLEEFIDAWESKRLHKQRKYWIEIFKELLLSSIFVLLYFHGPKFLSKLGAWLIFGIVIDAFVDIFIAFRGNFYKNIAKNPKMREFIRESLVPYIIIATVFLILKIDPIQFIDLYSVIVPLEFIFLFISEPVKSGPGGI